MSTPSRFKHSSTILAPGSFTEPSLRARCTLGRRLTSPESRLRCRQPRDRNHERRTGHVRHPYFVTKLYRRRLSAMLAADSDLQISTRVTAPLDADADQLADALLVEHRERVVLQNPLLQVGGQEFRDVVAAVPERHLRE